MRSKLQGKGLFPNQTDFYKQENNTMQLFFLNNFKNIQQKPAVLTTKIFTVTYKYDLIYMFHMCSNMCLSCCLKKKELNFSHNKFSSGFTINAECGLFWHGCPQVVGCVADIFALVALQVDHVATIGCFEFKWARVLWNFQVRFTAWVEFVSVLCPCETSTKKRKVSIIGIAGGSFGN